VIIKNDRTGEEVIYAHCQKILVSEGAKISNGDIVALLGATGRVTGPHLHIERHLKGQPVPFINMDRKDLMVLSALQDFVLFLAQVCLAE
jgi:murein DD-endopeptidase MepM/ murein hydrolase activator NlpD